MVEWVKMELESHIKNQLKNGDSIPWSDLNIRTKEFFGNWIRNHLEDFYILNEPEWTKRIQNPDNDFVSDFFYHSVGHFIGTDVHEHWERNELIEGSVFTLEPGFYFQRELDWIPLEFKRMGGVRIEDMYMIKNSDLFLLS
jgi:hypothetical protein